MPRITKVYTRGGDDGSTSLGSNRRVQKDHVRVQAYGDVDELNSSIGLVLTAGVSDDLREKLARIQNELFHLGSDLSVPPDDEYAASVPRIEPRHVESLEREMDEMMADLAPLENFVLPGGSEAAARLHLARTICRRAERWVVALAREEEVGAPAVHYLNRLSDALFVMARYENQAAGVEDVLWDSRA